MNKSEKNTETKAKEEKPETPKVKWAEMSDDTHGNGEYDLYGIKGLWREKGCREIGGMQVRVYLTSRAEAPLCNRAEKYTIVLTGVHEKAITDLNMNSLQKTGADTRKTALNLARHPASTGWSSKAVAIVERMEKEAAKKEAEEKAAAEDAKKTESEAEV